MFICTLAGLKKSSKKKETETEKHIAEVFNMLVTVEWGEVSKKSRS